MAKVYFYYSAMNAGKSTNLLQSNHNYHERGMDTLLFIPAIDDRYEHGKIHSRIGLQADAIMFDATFDIFKAVAESARKNKNLRCILIDEAQFLTKKQVKQLTNVADHLNIPVLAYGLRADFRGEPFEGSKYLLAWAEDLIELKTVCHCGRKAIMNMRIGPDGKATRVGEQIQIGGNETYIATCRRHFNEGVTGKEAETREEKALAD